MSNPGEAGPLALITRRSHVGFLSSALSVNALLFSAGFVSSYTMAHFLGASGRGWVASIQSIVAILTLISSVGIPSAATYLTAFRPEMREAYASSGLLLLMWTTIPTATVGGLVVAWLLDAPLLVVWAYMLVIPLTAGFQVLLWPMLSVGKYRTWNVLRLLFELVWLMSVLLFGTLTKDWRAVLVGHVAILVVYVAMSLRWIRSNLTALRPRRGFGREILKFGVPTMLSSGSQVVSLRADQVILIGFVTRSELGRYATAVGWSLAVLAPLQAVAYLAVPMVAGRAIVHRRRAVAKVLSLALVVAAASGVIGVVCTRLLFVRIFGTDFAPATDVAVILIGASSIFGVNTVVEECLRGLSRPRAPMVGELCGIAVLVPLLLTLSRSHGITGAAWSSVAGYGVSLLVSATLLIRVTGRELSTPVDTGPEIGLT